MKLRSYWTFSVLFTYHQNSQQYQQVLLQPELKQIDLCTMHIYVSTLFSTGETGISPSALFIGRIIHKGDFTQPHQKYAGTGEHYNIVIAVILYPVDKTS